MGYEMSSAGLLRRIGLYLYVSFPVLTAPLRRHPAMLAEEACSPPDDLADGAGMGGP